jgi:hypothetical protein
MTATAVATTEAAIALISSRDLSRYAHTDVATKEYVLRSRQDQGRLTLLVETCVSFISGEREIYRNREASIIRQKDTLYFIFVTATIPRPIK